MTESADAQDAEDEDEDQQRHVGAQRAEQALGARAEVLRLRDGRAHRRRPSGRAGRAGRGRSRCVRRSCCRLHRELRIDDLAVGLAGLDELVVSCRSRPSGRDRARRSGRRAGSSRPAARRRPGSRRAGGCRGRAGARHPSSDPVPRTSRRRCRCRAASRSPARSRAAGADRRRRSCRPARSAIRGPRAWLRRSPCPGRARARARAPRRSRRRRRSGGCDATVPENRKARCCTRPMRFHRLSGSYCAHVDAVDADDAAGDVEEARDEPDERRLARTGRADDRGGRSRLRR